MYDSSLEGTDHSNGAVFFTDGSLDIVVVSEAGSQVGRNTNSAVGHLLLGHRFNLRGAIRLYESIGDIDGNDGFQQPIISELIGVLWSRSFFNDISPISSACVVPAAGAVGYIAGTDSVQTFFVQEEHLSFPVVAVVGGGSEYFGRQVSDIILERRIGEAL